jgi:hypothetical protein
MKAVFFLPIFLSLTCFAQPNWAIIKDTTKPFVAISSEFGTAFQQPLSTDGWEDGIAISRDGLHLYCTYAPGDLLSWTLNSSDPTQFMPYRRGPIYGMDLSSNPVGASSWIQSDVLYATRNSVFEPFNTWSLSNMATAVFSEGGVSPQQSEGLIFTSNNKPTTYDVDVWQIAGYPNPSGTGTPLPNFPHTTFTEDNPHLERLSNDTLILLFDSDNYPTGKGGHDLWLSSSFNNGSSWSTPINIASINTADKEHQPFLHKTTSGQWQLYFSAYHDGKLAIFRAKQTLKNNWLDWADKELVIGAGNSAGVGEPTLTKEGDLSFVLVYEAQNGTPNNRFDADPWFCPHKPLITQWNAGHENEESISITQSYEQITVSSPEKFDSFLFDTDGRCIYLSTGNERFQTIKTNFLRSGIYFLKIQSKDQSLSRKIGIK